MNEASSTPLYLQLETILRDSIVKGEWNPGEALPSERDLSEKFNVSRLTLRKSIDRLVSQGMIERRQGSGTYVSSRLARASATLSGFAQEMRSRGLEPSFTWIRRSVVVAAPEEVLALSLTPGDKVSRLERIREADGEPIALEKASLSVFHLPEPEKMDDSLYEQLDRSGLRPVRALQRVRAMVAGKAEVKYLEVEHGVPMLYVERISYLSNGMALEFTRSAYRADRYEFVAELRP